MKTLFMDFDGVLHDELAVYPEWKADRILIEPRCFCFVGELAAVLDGHAVDIVVHSDWRLGRFTHDEMRTFLRTLGSRFRGTTVAKLRFESIRQYVAEHGITDYRILDDTPQLFPADLPALIACDPNKGVSDAWVQEQLRRWLAS